MNNALFDRYTLALAAGILAALTGGAVADRVLTDPSSGQRLLLRDDGTYTLLSPAGADAASSGVAAGGSSRIQPGGAPPVVGSGTGSAVMPGSAANPALPSGSTSTPTYTEVALEEVSRAAPGELVSLDGWIGNLGTGSRFLMFRDRTVSPPYVVVRMSKDAIPRQAVSPMSAPGSSRAIETWAEDLNGRCREACAARVEGAVLAAPAGGAPEVVAHHVDVSP